MGERFYVSKELFYIATECDQKDRFGVATGNFMLQHSWPKGEIWCRDSVSLSRENFCHDLGLYVMKERAMTETLCQAR